MTRHSTNIALPVALAAFVLGVCLLLSMPTTALAASDGLVAADGTYRYYRDGEPLVSTWKTVGGNRYYFDERGYAVQGKSKRIEGEYYIFSDKGRLLSPSKGKIYSLKSGIFYVGPQGKPAGRGWCIVSGKLYKVSKSGKCAVSKKIDGITLTKSGAAKNDTAAQLKMTVMKKLDQLTEPSMTKKQKLRACFNYCLTRKFVPSTLPKDVGTEGWVQRCALAALKSGKTQCYGFSCSFAAFAYELGYTPTIRESRDVHAWVMIGGKAYDNMGPRFGGSSQRFGNEKNWKFSSWGATSPRGSKVVEKASRKNGLTKEGDSYVFYQNGKRLKSQWKTIEKAKYYFQKNGRAATGPKKIKGKWYVFSSKGKLLAGKKTRVVKVAGDKYRVTKAGRAKAGWTTGKKSLYLENGRRATGVSLYKGRLYWFSKDGAFDKKKTAILRATAREGANASELLALIGDPQSSRISSSCHPLTAVYGGGQDVIYTYKNATLNFFKAPDGTMLYLGCG